MGGFDLIIIAAGIFFGTLLLASSVAWFLEEWERR